MSMHVNKVLFEEQCHQMMTYVMMEWIMVRGFEATGIAEVDAIFDADALPSPHEAGIRPGDACFVMFEGVFALTRDREWKKLFSLGQVLARCEALVSAGVKVPSDTEMEARLDELKIIRRLMAAQANG